jgi:hypothetical protein
MREKRNIYRFWDRGGTWEWNLLEGPGVDRRVPLQQVFKSKMGMYGLHSSGLG